MEKSDHGIRYAGYFTRLAVFLADLFVAAIILMVMKKVFGRAIGGTIGFVVVWLYWPFALSRWGTTIGGKLLGVRIYDARMQHLSFLKASLRFVVSVLPFILYRIVREMQYGMMPMPDPMVQMLPQLLYILPPFVMFFTSKRQMLHDLVAGSIVLDVSGRGTDTKKDNTVIVRTWGQRLLRLAVIAGFLTIFGYVFIYMSVFFMWGQHQRSAYNASFHTHYEVNDYNDSRIKFYQKELEWQSEIFVNAEGMYDIFAADTKRDLAINCIEAFLKEHNHSDWIDMGSGFRKNARNKFASTEELVKKAKHNEDYMGKHFYDYDLNDVNHIEDEIASVWEPRKNKDTCNKMMPVEEMYETLFIPKYIINREENLKRYKNDLQTAPDYGTLSKRFYRQEIKTQTAWLEELYRHFPQYKTLMHETQERRKVEKEKKRQKEKQKALWRAAQKRYMYPMHYFKGVNVNIFNEKDMTPLMVAAQKNNRLFAEQIWDAVVDVHLKNKEGKSAFDYIKKPATREERIYSDRMYGALRVLELQQMLKDKAKLIQYSYRNDTDRLEVLIEGASCGEFDLPLHTVCKERAVPKGSEHPIFSAIKENDYGLFEKLLDIEALSAKTKHGDSPLWVAIMKKRYKMVERLLKAGANIYEYEGNGLHSPLEWAAMHNDVKLLKILIDNGVDLDQHDEFDDPIIFTAMYKCNNFEAIEMMLRHGADPHEKNRRGKTVFEKKPVFCKNKADVEKMRALLRRF